MEAHLAKARRDGDAVHLRHSRIALGHLEESIDTSFVFEPGTELPATYDEETCAVLATGAGAAPQLWDAGAAVQVDWEAGFDPAILDSSPSDP